MPPALTRIPVAAPWLGVRPTLTPRLPPVLPALTPVGQGEVLMRKLEGELGLSRGDVVAFDELIQNEKRRRSTEAQGQIQQRAQQVETLRRRLEQQLDEVAAESEGPSTHGTTLHPHASAPPATTTQPTPQNDRVDSPPKDPRPQPLMAQRVFPPKMPPSSTHSPAPLASPPPPAPQLGKPWKLPPVQRTPFMGKPIPAPRESRKAAPRNDQPERRYGSFRRSTYGETSGTRRPQQTPAASRGHQRGEPRVEQRNDHNPPAAPDLRKRLNDLSHKLGLPKPAKGWWADGTPMTPKWREESPGPEEMEDAAGLWTPQYEGGDYWAPLAPTPKPNTPQGPEPADPTPKRGEEPKKEKKTDTPANTTPRKRARTSKAEREGKPRSRFQRTSSQDTAASSDEDLGLGWLMVEEVDAGTVGSTPEWNPVPTVEEPPEDGYLTAPEEAMEEQ